MIRLAVSLLLLTAGSSFSQDDAGVAAPLRIQTRATPDKVQLGQPFDVEIVITHEADQRYEFMPPADLGDFDFVGASRERVDGKGSSTTTFKVTLTGFKLDAQKTPPLKVQVSAPGGAQLIEISGTDVTIVSSLPADAQAKGENLFDIRPPMELPVRTWRVIYALLGVLIGAGLAYAIYRYLKRPKVAAPVVAPPQAPLHVRTLQALDDLAKQNLPGQGRGREFYFRLSEIMRGYLGELYRFEALESTTPELIEALRVRNTPGLPIQQLTEFANQSDFIRYAKTDSTPEQCKESLELGYRIVHATTAAMVPLNATLAPPQNTNGNQRVP